MAREYLGLFDTPPDRQEIRIGLVVVGLIYFTLLALSAARNIHVGVIPGFVPTITAAMLVCDLITAAILYAQAGVFRSRALTVLASGYVLGGLLLIPWALTFPGAFAADGLLGAQVNTTGWIAVFWRLSVPTAVVLYAVLKRVDATAGPVAERPPPGILLGVLVSIALAALVTLLATIGHDLLPSVFVDQRDVIRSKLVTLNVGTIAATIAAMVLLFRQRRSVLDLWLLVSMSAWLAQSLLNMLLLSRFTLGAYAFLALVLVSNLIVMLALITDSNRLYARLALSTAARNRERDARMMSMDALAAAVSHEVGQPLSAVITNAMAAQSWLDRRQPEPGMAIKAMNATIEAGQRTFDVIKSIRAMFAVGSPSAIEFDLNELVRETVVLMDLELTGRKVSLDLKLDEALPRVVADRVKMQRVLINLLTNAIEALDTKRRQPRRIAIRTMALDGQHVQLDMSDTGVGIPPEKMDSIFEPFFTTKGTGTGLGLSLCRTIVEEHGGHLWVSRGERQGAIFHLTLPTRRLGDPGGIAEPLPP